MKRCCFVAAALVIASVHVVSTAQAPQKLDPRQAAEAYLAAALAGKVKDAQALAEPGQADASEARIVALKKRLGLKKVSLPRVYVSAKGERALGISEVVQSMGDRQEQGQLVVMVSLRDGRWLVRDVDFRPQANAKEQVERFHRRYPDAKELPGKAAAVPVEKELALLQGAWNPAKNETKLRESAIQIDIRKSNVLIQYAVAGGGNMIRIEGCESAFELKQDGDKRRLIPKKKNAGISPITYRVEKDRLVIEEGTCGTKGLKGVWERAAGEAP